MCVPYRHRGNTPGWLLYEDVFSATLFQQVHSVVPCFLVFRNLGPAGPVLYSHVSRILFSEFFPPRGFHFFSLNLPRRCRGRTRNPIPFENFANLLGSYGCANRIPHGRVQVPSVKFMNSSFTPRS